MTCEMIYAKYVAQLTDRCCVTTYSPKDVEALTGVPATSLREQRIRLLNYPFGTQSDTGRWTYTPSDLLGLACFEKLQRQIPNQGDAVGMVNWIAPEVARHLGLSDPSHWHLRLREVAREAFPDADGAQSVSRPYKYAIFNQGNPTITDNPAYVADSISPFSVVVRLDLLANEIPERLVARLRADEIGNAD